MARPKKDKLVSEEIQDFKVPEIDGTEADVNRMTTNPSNIEELEDIVSKLKLYLLDDTLNITIIGMDDLTYGLTHILYKYKLTSKYLNVDIVHTDWGRIITSILRFYKKIV
jgi:hypothetical protein